jgi:hypothetical protein
MSGKGTAAAGSTFSTNKAILWSGNNNVNHIGE